MGSLQEAWNSIDDGLGEFLSSGPAADIGGMMVRIPQRIFHGLLDGDRCLMLFQVSQHECATEDLGHRIGNSLAGNIRCRAVHRFEKRCLGPVSSTRP